MIVPLQGMNLEVHLTDDSRVWVPIETLVGLLRGLGEGVVASTPPELLARWTGEQALAAIGAFLTGRADELELGVMTALDRS